MATPHGREHTPAVQARIDHIVGLMLACKWRTGKTGPELAKGWGVSLDVVEYASAAASRIVKERLGDQTQTGAVVLAVLEEAMFGALEAGERRDAIAAARALADIVGAHAPRKNETTVRQLGQMSDEDLERMAAKLVADVEKTMAARAAGAERHALPGPTFTVRKIEDGDEARRGEPRDVLGGNSSQGHARGARAAPLRASSRRGR